MSSVIYTERRTFLKFQVSVSVSVGVSVSVRVSAESRYAECLHAKCYYSECCYAKCRQAECRSAKCHYTECHTEYHYAECHYAKCRDADCRDAECRCAESRGALSTSHKRCNCAFLYSSKRHQTKVLGGKKQATASHFSGIYTSDNASTYRHSEQYSQFEKYQKYPLKIILTTNLKIVIASFSIIIMRNY